MATKAFQKIYTKITAITKATCSLKAEEDIEVNKLFLPSEHDTPIDLFEFLPLFTSLLISWISFFSF